MAFVVDGALTTSDDATALTLVLDVRGVPLTFRENNDGDSPPYWIVTGPEGVMAAGPSVWRNAAKSRPSGWYRQFFWSDNPRHRFGFQHLSEAFRVVVAPDQEHDILSNRVPSTEVGVIPIPFDEAIVNTPVLYGEYFPLLRSETLPPGYQWGGVYMAERVGDSYHLPANFNGVHVNPDPRDGIEAVQFGWFVIRLAEDQAAGRVVGVRLEYDESRHGFREMDTVGVPNSTALPVVFVRGYSELADSVRDRLGMVERSIVSIPSNADALLADVGLRIGVGFRPAVSLAEAAEETGVHSIANFSNPEDIDNDPDIVE